MRDKSKEPVKVIYEYADGSQKYIDGEELEKYNDNISAGGIMELRQPGFYKPVKWKSAPKKKGKQ